MHSTDQRPALEHPPGAAAKGSAAVSEDSGSIPSSLRQRLRSATSSTHARLHLHEGFAAIQNGTIGFVEYRALLVRLYGFHVSFEAAVDIAGERSGWLLEDLTALGLSARTTAAIPRCTALTALDTPAHRIGALYVVEGSTLGGRHLACRLDSLFGCTGSAGRRFFVGRGIGTNAAWNAFQARLTASGSAPADRTGVVESAVATFSIFEEWLQGWRNFRE